MGEADIREPVNVGGAAVDRMTRRRRLGITRRTHRRLARSAGMLQRIGGRSHRAHDSSGVGGVDTHDFGCACQVRIALVIGVNGRTHRSRGWRSRRFPARRRRHGRDALWRTVAPECRDETGCETGCKTGCETGRETVDTLGRDLVVRGAAWEGQQRSSADRRPAEPTPRLARSPGDDDHRLMNASSSSLTRSLRVVHIPCGAPS